VQVGLRISVATAYGAVQAVPRLLETLARHGATATFYFNLGPDRRHRLLPGRGVGARAATALAAARAAGCEVGLYGWDAARWPNRMHPGAAPWIEAALHRACEAFERLAGEPPRTHAAPGWQTDRHALRLTQRLGFHYASDTRGRFPFMPVCGAELTLCPQLPTTLPTLHELVDGGDASLEAAHAPVLEATARNDGAPDVFALRAELGATVLAAALERLLEGWRARGCEVVTLRRLFESLEPARLPRHAVALHELAGRAGTCAVQGPPFPPCARGCAAG
jgi:peptidoglycan/xylan/chitin deacetylase (PgdA/CDA1 family)